MNSPMTNFKLGKCHCNKTGRCCACSAQLHVMRLALTYRRIPPMELVDPPDALPGEGPYDPSDPND
jgi:hypothetical protein